MTPLGVVGWILALVFAITFAAARADRRYLLRSIWWRFRAPVGHRHHQIFGKLPNMASFGMASCECGYSERTLTPGGSRGALEDHLRRARPWQHYAGAEPCDQASEHPIFTDREVDRAFAAELPEEDRRPYRDGTMHDLPTYGRHAPALSEAVRQAADPPRAY